LSHDGWFGPRGLASIVFGVIVFNEQVAGNATLEAVVLSVVAHGVSVNPLLSALRARLGPAEDREPSASKAA
jgi:NhaP-type Na+/H+ or K+/H+ antiporter